MNTCEIYNQYFKTSFVTKATKALHLQLQTVFMKPLFTFLILFLLFSFTSFAQLKVVIMGSSTAYGVGASTYANSWAGRTEAFLNQNTTDGKDTVVYNISFPAYDSYQEMPDGFVPPPGRPLPDQDYNVTKALSYNPDVVIISLPSNDISYGYARSETMSNFRIMSSTIFANGARCYITTPQPRNDFDALQRDSLFSLVDSITMTFGPFAVNFWDCLVTDDGTLGLKDEYRATGTPHHLNDLGHEMLFDRIMLAGIFDFGGPVALQLNGFHAQSQNNAVSLKWHTEQQGANTSFELQKSADGRSFETHSIQNIAEARQSADYYAIDQAPFEGKTFYRVKITEAGRISYSGVISVVTEGRKLDISKIYISNATLKAEINVQKSQFVNVSIINTNGAVLLKQKEFVGQSQGTVNIPVASLAAGQYYLRVSTTDGSTLTKAFRK